MAEGERRGIESFIMADDAERREERETQKTHVVNIREEEGLPSRPEMREGDITGNDVVMEYLEPLRRADAPHVLIGIPHEGELVPEDLASRLTEEGRDTLIYTDVATRDVFGSPDIPHIAFGVSRYVTDPNRVPDFGLTPPTGQGKAPGKIFWRDGIHFKPLYRGGEEPTPEEAYAMAERFYLPYYRAMMGAVGQMLDHRGNPREERVLVIDGHSFPINEDMRPYYEHYGVKDPENLPLFILGTRDNQSCAPDILEEFARLLKVNFESMPASERKHLLERIPGGLVGKNMPFKGVHNVRFWGQQGQGVSCIQVECNERGYSTGGDKTGRDEKIDPERVHRMQQLIEQTAKQMEPLLRGEKK
jgi:N-formylglutamate amidohydrolase